MELKPYNLLAKCPKCGHDMISSIYCVDRSYDCPDDLDIDQEHICRQCKRCQFKWAEAWIRWSHESFTLQRRNAGSLGSWQEKGAE